MLRKTFSPIRKRVHGVFALLAAGILSFLFFTSCNSISHDELSEQEETAIHDLLARREGKESISREERLAFEKHLYSVPATGYILKNALAAKDDALFCWIAETKDFDEVFREAVEADPKLLTMACTRESMNWFISIYCESPFWYQPFDVLGNKLVHFHASHENCDGLKRLLPFQTDVNAKNNRGFTPLHIAFLYGSMDNIVKDAFSLAVCWNSQTAVLTLRNSTHLRQWKNQSWMWRSCSIISTAGWTHICQRWTKMPYLHSESTEEHR